MKILIVHNAYRHSGGEDAVVEAETSLLRDHGHEVEIYRRHNDELHAMSNASAAVSAIWSHRSSRELDTLCERFRPDVIHAHNTFPLISPAYAWTAARRGIPTVQTLHNFRLLCPQATFLRDGNICEDCLGRLPWRAVARKCYRDSSVQSAVSAGTLVAHRMMGTFRHRITRYIALSRFCRDKFIEGGLPAARIRIKPNFVQPHDAPRCEIRKGGLYVGRLSPEKGIDVLIEASRLISTSTLRVAGGGPLETSVKETFGSAWLGTQRHDDVLRLLGESLYLVAPSTCYESFGLALMEAFSCGTPVIASRRGAFAELVEDGRTGLLFDPGDAHDLAVKMQWADSHPEEMRRMGAAARSEYESRYTPQRNYAMLMEIYEDAIRNVHAEPGADPARECLPNACQEGWRQGVRRPHGVPRHRLQAAPATTAQSTLCETPSSPLATTSNAASGLSGGQAAGNPCRDRLQWPRNVQAVLNAEVDALSWDDALSRVTSWGAAHESRYVCICNVHSVVTTTLDTEFMQAVNAADMATPDGAPVAWALRKLGFASQERISGPDLMWRYLEEAQRLNHAVYFYGSTEPTLEKLYAAVRREFPALRIAGMRSPPFRPLSSAEDEDDVETINRSGANVVFVGLGCPKQEKWMADHRGRVRAVMIGVGAAFDYHAGVVRRAPLWWQRHGLEWLYRLGCEPRRLFRRYMVTNTLFVIGFARQLILQRFPKPAETT